MTETTTVRADQSDQTHHDGAQLPPAPHAEPAPSPPEHPILQTVAPEPEAIYSIGLPEDVLEMVMPETVPDVTVATTGEVADESIDRTPDRTEPDNGEPEDVMAYDAEPDYGTEEDGDEEGDEEGLPPALPPEPARTVFADLGLSENILRAIEEMGYRHPTPIQEQAIPFVLMGRDVLGTAQTGTGKTASFTLPLIDILTGSRARARMPRSLILEPTRELALQVAENFVQYGKYQKLTHALIIGGESMSDQKDILMRGVDVLIATPGRLIDMFERGNILLTDARVLVIDEADRMLDMGFIPDIERIVAMLPFNRQTLFFSATMGPEIRKLADAFLRNPKEIAVSRPASVATTITSGLALVAEHDKREALRRLIRTQNVQNALIFCNRKRDVDILYKSLNKHRFSVGALHGDMAQTVRFATLEKFKANELRLLVCSDVAARGLDIGGLSHVFNFDVPIHAEDYVHRIGRTGRAGMAGNAFTIAAPTDRLAVEAIEKLIRMPIPPITVEGLDPVDWAEDEGKRGRGRRKAGGKSAPEGKARPEPKAKPKHEDKPRQDERPKQDDRSRQDGGQRKPRPAPVPAPVSEIDPPIAPPPPTFSPAPAPRADFTPRAAPVPAGRPFREPEPARREWRRRDEDLGPSVVGFGDDVPAFMRLPTRASRLPVRADEFDDSDHQAAEESPE